MIQQWMAQIVPKGVRRVSFLSTLTEEAQILNQEAKVLWTLPF